MSQGWADPSDESLGFFQPSAKRGLKGADFLAKANLGRPIEFRFQLLNRFKILVFAAEDAFEDLRWGTKLGDRRLFQDLNVFDFVNALVSILIKQGLQNLSRLLPILRKVITLSNVIGPLSSGQRWLVKSNVANQIE